MSKKFNLITKTSYKDFCNKTQDIQIVEIDLASRRVTLVDKFENKIQMEYNHNNTIISLLCIGNNDPEFVLHLLVTKADAIFLCEDDYKKYIQVPLKEEPYCKSVKITIGTYEEFTKYFKDYVKYVRDFDKEFQIFSEKKRKHAETINQVSDSFAGGNGHALDANTMEEEQIMTNDIFELDEDYEIEKIDIVHQIVKGS